MEQKIKRALISVSDKTGVAEFSRELVKMGVEIVSTGGTFKLLEKEGVKVIEIDKVTGFPEILDGRVKTLNPKIHGGILALREKPEHLEELKKHSISPIDLVVVNLYPFEQTVIKYHAQKGQEINMDIIENIDIGGVTLLRAAGKNFMDVLIVCDTADYTPVMDAIKHGNLDYQLRKNLAAKAFRHTAYYDSLISGYFTDEQFPSQAAFGIKKAADLRYGENPHQKAALYKTAGQPGLVDAKQLHGKELSYNNYLDLDAALGLSLEFSEPSCVIVKHNNACGTAAGSSNNTPLVEVYKNALICDPVSAFGGIIAFNREVDAATAEEIVKLFTECIIAPGYSKEAKEIFMKKKDLRLLELPDYKKPVYSIRDIRNISGGMLMQDKDIQLGLEDIKQATKRAPTEQELASMKFAWKIAKHVKSNAIILVRGLQSLGVGVGQMSRIDSLKIAASKMNSIIGTVDKNTVKLPLVLASDAFFPFRDVVDEASKVGVAAIIQPGGSLRDDKSIDAANEYNMAMMFTGMRHFKH